MRYRAISEDEAKKEASKFGPWPNGVYDFEISEAADQTSSAGNEMIKLTIFVFNDTGDRRTVFDYLLESIGWKLRNAAIACGLAERYDEGELEAVDFYGKTGRVKLGIQPEKDGYPAKNVVRDYIISNTSAKPAVKTPPPRQAAMAGDNDLDDDIPF